MFNDIKLGHRSVASRCQHEKAHQMNQQAYPPREDNASLLDKHHDYSPLSVNRRITNRVWKRLAQTPRQHEWWTGAQAAQVFVIFDVHPVNL
jgi:hypothetical protein